jgi:ApbE superfamily uncharacterized protein (UPF0280 family)
VRFEGRGMRGVEGSGKVVLGSDRKVVVVMVATERLEGADGVIFERGEDWPCICFFSKRVGQSTQG